MTDLISHTFAPVFDAHSRILILGTMPSPRSRKNGFYYGHPQNRFWRILADVFTEVIPSDNKAKEDFLLRHKIALWDVLQSCRIKGADDSSITAPIPNDLQKILVRADIQAVFTTGQKATQLYRNLCMKQTGIAAQYLPSTSPANCARYSYDDLVREYDVLKKYI